jgi:hypothetical protein
VYSQLTRRFHAEYTLGVRDKPAAKVVVWVRDADDKRSDDVFHVTHTLLGVWVNKVVRHEAGF